MTQLERALEAVRGGVEMRRVQKDFFRTRDRGFLEPSKQLEKRFDQLCREALRPDDLLEGGT